MCLSTVLLCSWSCDWFYLWPQDEKDAVGFTVIQNCIRIYRKTDKTVCSNKVGRDTVIEQLFLWIYPIKLSVKLPRESCQHDHCTQKYIVRYFVLYSVKPGTHWRQSPVLLKPATNRRYGRLFSWFWRQIGNNLNLTACHGRHWKPVWPRSKPYDKL